MYNESRAEKKIKAKDRPYHYVYKITNNVNGKFYVGMRSSIVEPEKDTLYMGSGKAIEQAISKYGIDNFSKEVTASLDSREAAFELEELIVDSEFISRQDTYNQKVGGVGVGSGEDHPRYGASITEDHKQKLVQGTLQYIQSLTEEERQKIAGEKSRRMKEVWSGTEYREKRSYLKKENHVRWGMTHTDESKKKMSESALMVKKVVCCHCSKEGAPGPMSRFHFDNCKYKNEVNHGQ